VEGYLTQRKIGRKERALCIQKKHIATEIQRGKKRHSVDFYVAKILKITLSNPSSTDHICVCVYIYIKSFWLSQIAKS
jgi:hypothetical protein